MTILLLFMIGLGIAASQFRKTKLCVALIGGYIVNLVLIFTQRYVRPIFWSSDQQRFLDFANELFLLDFVSLVFSFDFTGSYVVAWFAALVFKVFGNDILYVNFFFVYAWLGTIIYSSKLSLLITNSGRVSFFVALFIILMPSVSVVNAAFLRESFIVFFLVSSVYFSFRWYIFKRRRSFFKSIAFMGLAGLFHGAFYFLCVFLSLFYFKEYLLRGRIRCCDLLLLFVLLPLLAVASMRLADNVKVQMALSLIAGDERANEVFLSSSGQRNSMEGINRLMLPSVDNSNSLTILVGVAARMVAFSFSPFVQHYYKVTDVPRIYDSIVFVFLWGLCVLSYVNSRGSTDKRMRFFFGFFIPMMALLVLMFSLGSGDVGTSQRHRLKFLPVFAVVTFSAFYVSMVLSQANIQKKKILGWQCGG